MPTKYTIEDAAPAQSKYTIEDAPAAAPTTTTPPQEGLLESLGHTFGVGKEEDAARWKELHDHPVIQSLKIFAGPVGRIPGMVSGAVEGGKRIAGQIDQAGVAGMEGNWAGLLAHTAQALPFVGPGITLGMEQLGPGEVINPAEAGTAVGTAIQTAPIVAEGVSDAVGPITRALKDKAASFGTKLKETATGTGPNVTADLVKKTQAGNSLADAHIRTQAAIETARNNALKEGNSKYNTVNEKLNPVEADPEFYTKSLVDAAESIKGSAPEPTFLKNIERRIETGDPIRYEDLQADYSRLGKELSKGTLPGDVYHAYDQMHEVIGDEMQRIADSKGMGDQLTQARAYWRRMKQAFGKPLGQTDVATSVLRSQSPEMAQKAETANRVRLMGSFDPDIPKAFKDLESARVAAKDAPTPVPGETNTVGPEEVAGAKGEGLQKRAELVRSVGQRIAKYGVGLKALWDGFHGNVESMSGDVAIGAAGYKTAGWIANVLEKPEVVKLLTQPTEGDIAQIPPELRGQFPAIIKAAQAKGITVDPRLATLVGVGTAVGPHTKRLRELADQAQ